MNGLAAFPARIVYEGREYLLDLNAVGPEQIRVLRRFGFKNVKDLASRVADTDVQALGITYWLMLVLNGETAIRLEDVNFKPVKFLEALSAASAELRGV